MMLRLSTSKRFPDISKDGLEFIFTENCQQNRMIVIAILRQKVQLEITSALHSTERDGKAKNFLTNFSSVIIFKLLRGIYSNGG